MKRFLSITTILISIFFLIGCLESAPPAPPPKNAVKVVKATVKAGVDGMTAEQRNIKKRKEAENQPGAIKHLYVISAMSGQVIIYSTVKGKVTSSGKRLDSPVKLIRGDRGEYNGDFLAPRMGEDGAYGSSIQYLYWWDVQGRYHQHYVSGGQIIHISDNVMPVKSIIINLGGK